VRGLVPRKSFMPRSRKRERGFTRERKMAFAGMLLFMLGKGKCAERPGARVPAAGERGGAAMGRQAFSKARRKIKWEELLRASVDGSCAEGLKLWRGYRLMAADGTFLSLPSDAALLEHFGGLGRGCASATALASLLYDL